MAFKTWKKWWCGWLLSHWVRRTMQSGLGCWLRHCFLLGTFLWLREQHHSQMEKGQARRNICGTGNQQKEWLHTWKQWVQFTSCFLGSFTSSCVSSWHISVYSPISNKLWHVVCLPFCLSGYCSGPPWVSEGTWMKEASHSSCRNSQLWLKP